MARLLGVSVTKGLITSAHFVELFTRTFASSRIFTRLHVSFALQFHLSLPSMTLEKIYWNHVYRRHPHTRAMAELRIRAHYLMFDHLWKTKYAIISSVPTIYFFNVVF
jgi:hypothetical protein